MIKLDEQSWVKDDRFYTDNKLCQSLLNIGYFEYSNYTKDQIKKAIEYKEGEPICYVNELFKDILFIGDYLTDERHGVYHFNLAILANGNAAVAKLILEWIGE